MKVYIIIIKRLMLEGLSSITFQQDTLSDGSGSKINVFNHNGRNIFTIDGNVTGDHSFQLPYGLPFDPLGNIHVAASGSNTIKVFTKESVYIRKYGYGTHACVLSSM